MSDVILLDTGPLGLVAHPKASKENDECNEWLRSTLTQGKCVLVPGISDYELRRELLRMGSSQGLAKLDALKNFLGFVPITTDAMNQAAEFWAKARSLGKPTAPDQALDGDMILSGQAVVMMAQGHSVV
ncbi:MAG: hypothetical protein ACRERS_07475, partial [Methylococcales bacterium]